MSIISVSGRIFSGKDTVGRIIQIVTDSPHFTNEGVVSFLDKPALDPKWEIKKFADKLKDIVCMLLGCSREQLEDREFKEKPLGEEWHKFISAKFPKRTSEEIANSDSILVESLYEVLTPRKLLQRIGTDLFRDQLHPNIWVNALMSEYKGIQIAFHKGDYMGKCKKCGVQMNGVDKRQTRCKKCCEEVLYPNWIITDTRFPNELKAVKDKEGITIRVIREDEFSKCLEDIEYFYSNYVTINGEKPTVRNIDRSIFSKYKLKNPPHESETALDNAEFDYVIENDGTLLELVEKVRKILTKEKIL